MYFIYNYDYEIREYIIHNFQPKFSNNWEIIYKFENAYLL